MSKEWLLQKPGAETGRQGCCPELTARKPEAVGAGSYQGGKEWLRGKARRVSEPRTVRQTENRSHVA